MDIETHLFWVGVDCYRPHSLAKQGNNNVRPSICSSVCLSVSALTSERFDLLGARQRVKKRHYQSMRFVCVSNNCADTVDWLLLLGMETDS